MSIKDQVNLGLGNLKQVLRYFIRRFRTSLQEVVSSVLTLRRVSPSLVKLDISKSKMRPALTGHSPSKIANFSCIIYTVAKHEIFCVLDDE